VRIVALISGSGTTLQNLLDRNVGEIVGVIASAPGLGGIARAERAGLPVAVLQGSERIFAQVREWRADIVCLCGWLKLLAIPADFENRVLNIHPSLLPRFGGRGMYGQRVHQAVLQSGDAHSGCTVHLADNTYDTGPILVQKRVPVLAGDTPETLAKRVFAAECEAYPEAIRMVEAGFHRAT
jgi:phosphoribosylglycinamide formyltransferase-1